MAESEEKDIGDIIADLKKHMATEMSKLKESNQNNEQIVLKLTEKINDYEVKIFDMQHFQNKQDKLIEQVKPMIDDLTSHLEDNEHRVVLIQQEMKKNDEEFEKGGPFSSPAKHLKYIERRIVLSERSLLQLEQVLNLYNTEKKTAIHDMGKRLDSMVQYKHEFA